MRKFTDLTEAKGQIVFAFGRFNPDNVSISKLGESQKLAIQIMANNGWR